LRKNNGGLQWKGNHQCGKKRPEHDHLGCYATAVCLRRSPPTRLAGLWKLPRTLFRT